MNQETRVGSLNGFALEHLIVQTVGDDFNTLDTKTLIDTDLRNAG